MSVPAFSDIAKPANDLLNKDFYHLSASTFEFKDNAPNGVAFKVTGKSSHDKHTSAAIEGKYTDKPTGTVPPPPMTFQIVARTQPTVDQQPN
ncbi:hypothetical protein NLG97_g10777 [Lecanicillium saksenae]|uniref:Uncharacterized protein n=1 Tax=Lecanicillium saksenae TaxID=468837 RepID=A0ACC1QC85_9HYPO|nr:hypothetical protein NLG97_g10777 [Lecanicillium saksenae]